MVLNGILEKYHFSGHLDDQRFDARISFNSFVMVSSSPDVELPNERYTEKNGPFVTESSE